MQNDILTYNVLTKHYEMCLLTMTYRYGIIEWE